ncbi:MAG: response regulator [Defluviitaleaceae bacterium]|nr:response regulator [Defluviitaleaceae bacterium]MCL2240218.1 response regulator [Defluviitaleaceae bacterium]
MKTILIVDDNSTNLLVAENVLSPYYEVITALSASLMFELLEDIIPDLILLDVLMPDTDGFEVIAQLRKDSRYADIPVMFLTSQTDAAVEARGFESGVVDFIAKPFFHTVLLSRIKKHLAIDQIIRERTQELEQLKDSIASAVANAVEKRATCTGRHMERTASYVEIFIAAMLKNDVYADELKKYNPEVVASAARLHDLGKIRIPDAILSKPSKLSQDEFSVVKTHATEGEKIVDEIAKRANDAEFLSYAKMCAGSHHERWDGTGYPRNLKGEEIPLLGRIMAIVDVYDALVSVRPYKVAFSHEDALEIIRNNRGSHFDPQMVDVFLDIHRQFAEVRYTDQTGG